jgi:hypothetical protein
MAKMSERSASMVNDYIYKMLYDNNMGAKKSNLFVDPNDKTYFEVVEDRKKTIEENRKTLESQF